jgi:hypothetical protein
MKFPSFQDPTGSVHKKVTKVMGVVSFHIARVPILLASMPIFFTLNFFFQGAVLAKDVNTLDYCMPSELQSLKMNLFPATCSQSVDIEIVSLCSTEP